MNDAVKHELLALTARLLEAVVQGDWNAYETLCDASLSAFEPEAGGQLVEGLEFHKFYFTQVARKPANVTICSPHVRMLGPDAAVVSYVRLVQSLDENGAPQTLRSEETRVWHRRDGAWRHVHLHRSASG